MEVLRRVPSSTTLELGRMLVDRLAQMVPKAQSVPETTNQLPAVLMRSGTSKGLFVHRHHLPRAKESWSPILSAAMGSYTADKRQLDGVGGASSTTSKAAIISRSAHPDADVDYTFAQVGVGQNKVDLKGSCGNICSGVGAFALDEGLVRARPLSDQVTVRVHDTNTGAIIDQRLHVDKATGRFNPEGDYAIPGYSGSGSPIVLSWKNAAGTVGRKLLFPTGNRTDVITLNSSAFGGDISVRASLVDAANPFVFVDAASLPESFLSKPSDDPEVLDFVEAVRCRAAVMYGLANTPEEAHLTRAIPKIAILHDPKPLDAAAITAPEQTGPYVRVVPYSMGKPHPSFQLTGILCLSVALSYPGTVAASIERRAQGLPALKSASKLDPQMGDVPKLIAHPSGFASAIVTNVKSSKGENVVDKISMVTTAQKIFKGDVYVSQARKEAYP